MILDCIDGVLVFPRAGRARDDVRPGMRTTGFRKCTLIAYEVDGSLSMRRNASVEQVLPEPTERLRFREMSELTWT